MEARGKFPPTLNITQFPIGSLRGGGREGSVKTYVTKTPFVSRYKGGRFWEVPPLTLGLRWLRMRLLWTNSYMELGYHCCIQQIQHSIRICLHMTVQSATAVYSKT